MEARHAAAAIILRRYIYEVQRSRVMFSAGHSVNEF